MFGEISSKAKSGAGENALSCKAPDNSDEEEKDRLDSERNALGQKVTELTEEIARKKEVIENCKSSLKDDGAAANYSYWHTILSFEDELKKHSKELNKLEGDK